MSPHAANSLVHDLVQMAQAMETLPKVQEELELVKAELAAAYDIVQSRELRIIDLKTAHDELQAKLQSAEAARDDAELRFLEADDKSSEAIRTLDKIINQAFAARGVLAPPKEEVKVIPTEAQNTGQTTEQSPSNVVEISTPSQALPGFQVPTEPVYPAPGQSVDPLHISGASATLTGSAADATLPTVDTAPAIVTNEGVSVPSDPTVKKEDTLSPIVSSDSVPSSASVSSPDSVERLSKPYAYKRYYDMPGWISRMEWLAGGGTEESYDWRPTATSTASHYS